MLIEFKVSNFRSIGAEQILSLQPATNQKEYLENIFTDSKNAALNVIAMYGANGSGKSNMIKAFGLFINTIRTSAKASSIDMLAYDPFLLREGWESKPTRFEIVFSLEGLRYRYGFEYDTERIIKEWLFKKDIGREVNVFQRFNDIIDPSSSLKGNTKLIDAAIEATRNNSLFLATLDMLNIEEGNKVFSYLQGIFHIDGMDTRGYVGLKKFWETDKVRKLLTDYLKRLKLGLIDIEAKEEDVLDKHNENNKEFKIFAKHKYYDKNGEATDKVLTWDYIERESSGSIKVLEISIPIMIVLATGGTLVIDEIEAKMHPLLTLDAINLFLNKETNPTNAQLIFATHDTNLLSYCKLRRDQIYFAEKNNWESTEIYSLSDFVYVNETGKESKERPDTDKEKRYIEGRYGAIPVLGPMSKLQWVENG